MILVLEVLSPNVTLELETLYVTVDFFVLLSAP